MILCLVAKDFEHDGETFETGIINLVVWDVDVAGVLEDADSVGVACVLVGSVERSMPHGLVLAVHVGLMNADFDEFLSMFSQVRQRYHRAVQEFWQNIPI